MKKNTFKSFTLKLLALVVAVCAGVAVATVSSEKPVAFAAEVQTPSFALTQGASIRYPSVADEEINGEPMFYKGIKFETKINKAWLDENKADKYWYGTLIFPTKFLDSFDPTKGSTENKENLQAVKVIRGQGEALTADTTFEASLVYDKNTIEAFTGVNADNIDSILKHLYAMDMTAISYVQFGDTIKYSAPYTDSMIKVAARLQSNKDWAERASAYLGDGEVETIKTYAVDDNNIVKGFDAQNASIVAIGNETLTAGVDYTIENGALTLNADYVKANKGVYEDIFVFDANNNLTIINVLYATDEIKTADDYMSTLVYGEYDANNHATYVSGIAKAEADRTDSEKAVVSAWTERYAVKDGVYVLANDIDLTGKTVRNSTGGENNAHWGAMPAVVKNAAFTGIFDGFGHSISNVTVSLNGYYYVNGGYPVICSTGLFPTIKKGAAIRNVAIINLKSTNNSNKNQATWTGVLTDSNSGTIENVYVDVNPSSQANAGVVLLNNGIMKNVVVNYPITFDYATASTVQTMRGLFGNHSVGALVGNFGESTGSFDNVYVVSKSPLSYSTGTSFPVTNAVELNKDLFYYGENEETLWYNHSVLDELDPDNKGKHTVQTAVAKNAKGKARVVKGIRRYNFAEHVGIDKGANLKPLLDSGLFKLVNNSLVWHDEKLALTVSDAIDYEASSGIVDSSLFNSIDGIEKITVNGIELTNGNGYSLVGDKIVLHQRESDSSAEAGVPYISKTTANKDQKLTIVVENEDIIYTFTNVTYWTEIYTTGEEFDAKYDYGKYVAGKVYPIHNGYYTLGNDIDMTGLEVHNQVGYAHAQYSNLVDVGLTGTFDGRGYSIYNATLNLEVDSNVVSTGFFGSMYSGSLVQNVALINLHIKTWSTAGNRSWTGILTGNGFITYGGKPTGFNMVGSLKNIYVDINDDSTTYFAGLVGNVDPYGRTSMENIVVNFPGAKTFDYEDDCGIARTKMLYGEDGFGTLVANYGDQGSHDKIKNVYSISPLPVGYKKNGTALNSESLSNDVFIYGGNETDLWYEHPVLDSLDPDNIGKHTVQTVSAKNPEGKARVITGIRRYDNMEAFAKDTTAENQTMTKVLTDTGYFKLLNGQIVWHTQKIAVKKDAPVDYEASSGELLSTEFAEIDVNTIEKIVVNGIELTEENSGYEIVDGKIKFNQRLDETADIAGVPYKSILLGNDQNLVFEVYVKDFVYRFEKVTFWTEIFTTGAEFDEKYDYGAVDLEKGDYTRHDGFYTLGNDIDLTGLVIENHTGNMFSRANNTAYLVMDGAGLKGIFDGRGYAINNATLNFGVGASNIVSTGLFGTTFTGSIIRNVAVIDVKVITNESDPSKRSYSGILTGAGYGKAPDNNGQFSGIYNIKNVYVKIADDSSPYFAGIVSHVDVWHRYSLENIVVHYPNGSFDYTTASSTSLTRGLGYYDGTGALFATGGKTNKMANIYVISPMPVAYCRYAYPVNQTDAKALDNDIFYYGENETELWFKHTVLDELDPANAGNHTVQTASKFTVSGSNSTPYGKANIITSLRRYNDMMAFANDTTAENQALMNVLLATKLFKVENGAILWHSQA